MSLNSKIWKGNWSKEWPPLCGDYGNRFDLHSTTSHKPIEWQLPCCIIIHAPTFRTKVGSIASGFTFAIPLNRCSLCVCFENPWVEILKALNPSYYIKEPGGNRVKPCKVRNTLENFCFLPSLPEMALFYGIIFLHGRFLLIFKPVAFIVYIHFFYSLSKVLWFTILLMMISCMYYINTTPTHYQSTYLSPPRCSLSISLSHINSVL